MQISRQHLAKGPPHSLKLILRPSSIASPQHVSASAGNGADTKSACNTQQSKQPCCPQVGAQKQAAAAKAPVPEPESTPQDPQPTLPTAHQLARILAFKAEALLVASGAIQSQPAPEGRFAVPGKDASAVKQYLAGAGLLVRAASMHAVALLPCLHLPATYRCCAATALACSVRLRKMSCCRYIGAWQSKLAALPRPHTVTLHCAGIAVAGSCPPACPPPWAVALQTAARAVLAAVSAAQP